MPKPKIKAIIFDLGGVIMSGGYLPFLRHYCLECLTPQGQKRIEKLEHQVNTGVISERQFYSTLQKVFHIHLSSASMHDLIVAKMKVNKALVRFIPHLKKEKIVLFTNSIGHMAPEVLKQRRVPVKKIFSRIFISSRIHLAKPDAKAYRYVIKQLNIKPREALLVDDRQSNVTKARQIGLNGLVYKNVRQFRETLKDYDLT